MGDFDASITTLKKAWVEKTDPIRCPTGAVYPTARRRTRRRETTQAFQHLGVDSDNLKVEIHDWLAQAAFTS